MNKTIASITVPKMADEIRSELDRLLTEWLSGDRMPGTKERTALELFLWDNKVGILRCLEELQHCK